MYAERIRINKPITLRGAGWDKTTLDPGDGGPRTEAEKIAFADALENAASDREIMEQVARYLQLRGEPTVTVEDAQGVTLEALGVQGPAPKSVDGLTDVPLVRIVRSTATLSDCAIVGPFMNGVNVIDGADVTIDGCLVAGIWNVGVLASTGDSSIECGQGTAPRLVLTDSDVRNCYHRCIAVGADDVTIERCRISGSAWHGLRYDGCAPTIRGNRFSGSARTGIYASGKTAANVTENIFTGDDTYTAWFHNEDVVERNPFVDMASAVHVLGASKPTVRNNLFANCERAIWSLKIGGKEALGEGQPVHEGNWFWNVESAYQTGENPAVDIERSPDPGLAADHTLTDQSPAAEADVGATPGSVAAAESPFPLQSGEKQIIPDNDTRDYKAWKKPG